MSRKPSESSANVRTSRILVFFACPKTQQVVTGPFRRRLLALARRRCEGGVVGAEVVERK